MVRVPPRTRPILLGLVLAAGYVAVVHAFGAHDLLIRRPVLDGLAPPPPYRWVSPPPALRASNQRPATGRFTVDLAPGAGSEAKVFSTSDAQASVALAQGAIPARTGVTSATLTVTPLAAKGFPSPSTSSSLAGNVYRFAASFEPSGTPVTRLSTPGQVVLFYPPPPTVAGYRHAVVFSADGRAWKALPSQDSPTQQLVQANASALGYFAVSETAEGGETSGGRSWGSIVVTALVVLAVAATVIGIAVSEIRHRARREGAASHDGGNAAGGERTRGPASRKRTPPRRRRKR